MSVLVALTVGLVFWIIAWTFGIKAFDAFLVTLLLVISAAAVRAISPFVKQLPTFEPRPASRACAAAAPSGSSRLGRLRTDLLAEAAGSAGCAPTD